jgi:hypothetical protein
MTLDEWLDYGYGQRYCSKPVCDLHEGPPRTITELDRLDAQHDDCIYVVRIFDDLELADTVFAEQKAQHS